MARNRFDTDEQLDEQFNPHIVKRLFQWVVPYKKQMITACAFMMLSALASLSSPYLIRMAIDKAIPEKNITMLFALAGALLCCVLIVRFCLSQRLKIMTKLAQTVIVTIRKEVFSKLQKLPFTYFDSRPQGKIQIRVVNYVNSLSDLLSNGIIQLITDFFRIIVILCFMFAIDPRLTLICMASLPVLIVIMFLLKRRQHDAWMTISHKQANLNAYLSESLNGMKITQSFAREEKNTAIFLDLCNAWKSAWYRGVTMNNIIWPVIDNLTTIANSLVIITGIRWLSGDFSVGTLVAFTGYIWQFWAPIQNIGQFYNSMITTGAYLERIFELLDEPVHIEDAPGAVDLPPIRGHVHFDHVNFEYDEGNPILKDVDFDIKPGTSVAIVGPTGAGKTTIVNLLTRFYNPKDGRILIDGIDLKSVTIKSVREQVGVMLQDSFLFSGTIMDNIRYGRLDATDEEVIAAAKTVQAHGFISAFPNGYQTKLTENGGGLSAGQKQLISFARVLLSDPRILILDEATSSVDTETELLVQKGLHELLKGRTSFIIAHRLSTIRDSDIIFFVNHGQIKERGNHEELHALHGEYWGMYDKM